MMLEGHYLRKLVTDDVDPKARIQRKIPDRPPQEAPCTDTAFNCAQFFASRDAQTQFESSGCNNCHEIFDNGGADLHSRFQVLPVKLAGDFLTRSRFNHDAHMTLVGEDGDSSCGICHQASASSASTDVLIPDVQVCQSCHDNPGSLGKVGMNCVSCHEFHRPPAAVLDFDVAANEGQ
jgi:predicted CXXCH cytochrome family protein